ncbi:hypothetical protein SAMN05445756_2054 [Kytococcus aerolatus]|uniref:Lipoprotein n=1 Tax=Kytococcus aerolatus TaxID=592308 RepID=A0A212U5S4_9MICO|nr:hypothetical protein [Kytococcus aerolatus]SNC73613.1 hypothetical protein SAMN05445756_2054 [Kytococcus aerolatus]
MRQHARTTMTTLSAAAALALAGCGFGTEEAAEGEGGTAEAPASAASSPAAGESGEDGEETPEKTTGTEQAEPSTVTVTETATAESAPDPEAAPTAESSSHATAAPAEPAPEQTAESPAPATDEPSPAEQATAPSTPPESNTPEEGSSTPAAETTSSAATEETADQPSPAEQAPDGQEVDLEAAKAELAEIGGPYVEVALLPGDPESGGSGLFGLTADDEENVVFWKKDVTGWRQIDDSKHPGTLTDGITARILSVPSHDLPLFLVEGQFRQNGEAGTLLYGFADGRGMVPLQLRGDRLQPAEDDSMTDPTLFSSATVDDGAKTLVTTRLDLDAGVPMVELGKYPPVEETWAGAGDHLRLQERTGGVPEGERRG